MESKWRLASKVVAYLDLAISTLLFLGVVSLLMCLYTDPPFEKRVEKRWIAKTGNSVGVELAVWIGCGVLFLFVVFANQLRIAMKPEISVEESVKRVIIWMTWKICIMFGWVLQLIFRFGKPDPFVSTLLFMDFTFFFIVTKYVANLKVELSQEEEPVVLFQNINEEVV